MLLLEDNGQRRLAFGWYMTVEQLSTKSLLYLCRSNPTYRLNHAVRTKTTS